MAFVEKKIPRSQKIDLISQEDQINLYTSTYRCPDCYIVPAIDLLLDLDVLTVKTTCECGTKDFEINDYMRIFGKDFRGNIQCDACKVFATNNNTIFKYCLTCKKFFCGECQYDHIVKEEHALINFRDVGSICNKHNIYYKAYCKKCQQNICKYCYPKHSSHKVVNYNSLYISDLEMADLNKNYGKVQLIVLIKDTEIKETIHGLLQDADELKRNYVTDLFDENKKKNQSILAFFKMLLTLYNNTENKNYNIIMNVRKNIAFNTYSLEIKDLNDDDNNLLNKFYLYAKNHLIAKKPKPFKEKYEKIQRKNSKAKTEMDDCYQEVLDNINDYLKIIKNEELLLNDNINVQIQGPFKYKSYIYFGEYMVDKLIPHGRGILIYKNGDRYYGNFENGEKSKKGIYYFQKEGVKYKGEWKSNKMDGYGVYHYANGTVYEGYFKDNKRNGFGIITTSNGDVYQAFFENGNISEFGTIIYKDGRKYHGFMQDYKKNGSGILFFPNGDKYKGLFKEDNFDLGYYKYKNGNSYFGNYKDNKMNGYGRYNYAKMGEIYQGQFVNDQRRGVGRFFRKNGDIYEGYVYDDLENGFGIMNYNNGDYYKGMFFKGMRHGIGIFYDKKGDEIYIGEWVADKQEGVATIYNRNWLYQGSVKNGIKDGFASFSYENKKYFYSGPFRNNMWEGYGTIKTDSEDELYVGKFFRGRMPKIGKEFPNEEHK